MELGGTGVAKGRGKETPSRYKAEFGRKLRPAPDEKALYASQLMVYDTIPHMSLSVTDFEKFAVARLKVLRTLERVNLMTADKFSKEWAQAAWNELRKAGVDEFMIAIFGAQEEEETVLGSRKFDHISHLLLRLTFAGTEEHRKWFISLEMDLFRLKLMNMPAVAFKTFLKDRNFPGELLTKEEIDEHKENIIAAWGIYQGENRAEGDIYRIEFPYAIDLVKQRKVFLRHGYAYIAYTDLLFVVSSSFRSYLSESMSLVKKNIHVIQEDPRLMQLVTDFDKRYTGGKDYSKQTQTGIRADDLPQLSQTSFPLCMKSLYDVVVKEHHLKHFGRLQLGLFFKGAGVPMDEATKFWRGHFTKRTEIDGNRFDKQYLYNIRHMYGHEGKRADYTPYSCMKVIMSNVGPGECHGCPFKHSDQANLRQRLVDAQVSKDGIKEIMDLAEKQHYQIACQRYFEATHTGATPDGGVHHPNQYFEESRNVLTGKKTLGDKASKIETKRVMVYSSQNTQPSQVTNTENLDDGSQAMEVDQDGDDFLAAYNEDSSKPEL